jgi:HPt (histidine-containing phosphotransfer) domain-containing protein
MGMMDGRLKEQMDAIGARYLQRTVHELPKLEELLAGVEADPASIKAIEQLAHRIYGSGAMFGFDGISARAHEVEVLAANGPNERLATCVRALEDEVLAAAKQRGVA